MLLFSSPSEDDVFVEIAVLGRVVLLLLFVVEDIEVEAVVGRMDDTAVAAVAIVVPTREELLPAG